MTGNARSFVALFGNFIRSQRVGTGLHAVLWLNLSPTFCLLGRGWVLRVGGVIAVGFDSGVAGLCV